MSVTPEKTQLAVACLKEGLRYGDTINLFDIAHRKSLAGPRNLLFVTAFAIMGASWWLGAPYALANLFHLRDLRPYGGSNGGKEQ